MNIIILKSITNTEGMDDAACKVYGALFTKWKHGQFEDMKMPTNKELQKLTNLTDKPITRAIKLLQNIRVKDRFQQTMPLLHLSTKKLNGRIESVYTLAAPEFGELTDPTAFTQEGGGSATMSALGGYFVITDEIQKLRLPINREIVLSAWDSVIKFNEYNYPVYNAKTIHIFDMLGYKKFETLKRTTYELSNIGYIEHSERVHDKSWGWKSVSVNLNPKQEDEPRSKEDDNSHIEEDDVMNNSAINKQLLDMIQEAMKAGNMELANNLSKALAGNQGEVKAETPSEQPKAEKKPRKKQPKPMKNEVEELDYQNDYIKVWLRVPKSMSKNPTIMGMISGLKDSLAYHWYTYEDVEASGYIDALNDYNIKMTYEVLQDAPKVESEPETLEDVIEASRRETLDYFKNEPEWVDKAVNVIVEAGIV